MNLIVHWSKLFFEVPHGLLLGPILVNIFLIVSDLSIILNDIDIVS